MRLREKVLEEMVNCLHNRIEKPDEVVESITMLLWEDYDYGDNYTEAEKLADKLVDELWIDAVSQAEEEDRQATEDYEERMSDYREMVMGI